jgi:hypothetical protein
MTYYGAGPDYVVVLARGEEIMASLREFVQKNKVHTAWLQALGAALEVELGYYNLDNQQYHWKTFTGPLEITNLTGNITQKDGEPVFHIHGAFASDDYGATGGHVRKMTAAATTEILIHKLDVKLTRKHDSAVGLDLLCPIE